MADTSVGTRPPETTAAQPDGERHSPLLRYLPFVVVGALLTFAVAFAAVPPTNYDTYFHLRFGSEFLDGKWSLTHPGTVTQFATAHWVPTQWSSEMVMAAFEKVGGLGAVAWLFGAVFIGYIVVLYRAGRLFGGPLAAAVAAMIAVVGSYSGLSARPQMISYIFVALTTMAWLRTARDGRIRWWLIPLTWLWATAHGMWPVGIAIGIMAALGLTFDGARGRRKLFLVPALSAIAAAVTPVGPSLYGAVLTVTGRRDNFPEWGPPVWTSPHNLILAAGIVAVLVTALRGRISTTWLDALLIVTALGWSLYSIRTVPVAAAMFAPFIARAIQAWLPERREPRRESRVIVLMAGCALAILAALVPSRANHVPTQPAWIQSSLSQLPAGTVLLDDQGFGAYIMWRFPQIQLVTDGYEDTFTDAEVARTNDLMGAKPGWLADVQATHAQWAFLASQSSLAYDLIHAEGWTVVHSSSDWVLLHAPAQAAVPSAVG